MPNTKIHYHPYNNIYKLTYCGKEWNTYNEDTDKPERVTCKKCKAKIEKLKRNND